jgi:tRNA dimethylallyltransferase
VLKLALYPENRAWLHRRIEERFQTMLVHGLVDEARALFARPELTPALPSLRTVGYRQVGLYLSGMVNYNRMIEMGVGATRQLAKRQLTWLRASTDCQRFDCSASVDVSPAVLAHLFARLSV